MSVVQVFDLPGIIDPTERNNSRDRVKVDSGATLLVPLFTRPSDNPVNQMSVMFYKRFGPAFVRPVIHDTYGRFVQVTPIDNYLEYSYYMRPEFDDGFLLRRGSYIVEATGGNGEKLCEKTLIIKSSPHSPVWEDYIPRPSPNSPIRIA